ncbi:YrhK family protein [Arthrobacter sp. A5]|uniref:YrhK family protein n=1 Tax=Arthrobacter sp. A5 TaxID=576926 RepID=UPI003DA98D88
MRLFDPSRSQQSPAHARWFATIELIYTVVDFTAAALFIIGSILFFSPSAMSPALWCFLIGSVCFALKPTLRLVRQLHYLKLDKIDKLAEIERHPG